MSVASCGCDATFAGLAACSVASGSGAGRPTGYDGHRRLMRPCLHPVMLCMELLDDRGWGWAARDVA